jgi:protein-L-isoaspartate(D-aspartate) O-methyltransferase
MRHIKKITYLALIGLLLFPVNISAQSHVEVDTVFTADDTITWQKPRFDERQNERHQLVERNIASGLRAVRDNRVIAAMKNVPRHLFMPKQFRDAAYADRPLPIGQGQTISQPYIVAYMTEQLELEPGDRVLEIGTGSGYQAAVLSEITPFVFTIEIIPDLAKTARSRFKELGYNTIEVKIGDGYYGWEEHAPYDAIIGTAAADEVPQPLIDQLNPGGRLIIPTGETGRIQKLILLTKDESGEVSTKELLSVRFVPMTGEDEEN